MTSAWRGTQRFAIPVHVHSFHAVVNAIADIHIKPPRLTKERFVAWGATAEAVAGGVVLGIRLGFHHHAPEQAAVCLAFHQQATDEVGGDQLGGAGEEGLEEGWEVVDGLRSGLKIEQNQAIMECLMLRGKQST